MNIICLIQARMDSTRFPGKVMADLCGSTVLQRVWDQASKIQGLSHSPYLAWPYWTPHREENDVLGRFADIARELKPDGIVRITGDCPLFDPQIGTRLVRQFATGAYDYVSNVWPRRTWPDGMDCEVFITELLLKADISARTPEEREHVTPWIRDHAETYWNWELPVDWSSVRLTVDTKEDLEWLKIAINSPRSSGGS